MTISPLKLLLLAVLGFVAYKALYKPETGATVTNNPNTANNNIGSQDLATTLIQGFTALFNAVGAYENAHTNPPTQ
jgi:hypothetical protein